jgi:hypothetical protein
MLLRKKIASASTSRSKIVPIRGYGRQLESLYARRSAVETLIRSLEDYQRFRAQKPQSIESKTA